ncbi:heparin lyase I family protein [Stigmatella sp. ncwal1]|uniref:Heparin lyase I family protein n=1 Tax=Stigmatella ashevillensis TaxID=2995309 RepID=A0ABT5D8H1_9BACT|nr:heparin lyase I family protein [Stigmatella ashevillena]MDC0709957.1 heparin lyase I family protein [Stigmatella ashevillena]
MNKKSLFLTTALLAAPFTGCGPGAPSEEDASLPVDTQAEGLTLQNCTALTPTAVTAIGDDGDGSVASNTQDDNLATRWSHLGPGSWIQYDLGSAKNISGAAVAWHMGNTRTSPFSLAVSTDGSQFTSVYSGTSSGTTTAAETYRFTEKSARYLRIRVDGNSASQWSSITEARVCATPQAAPAPSPNVVWRGDFETGSISQWSHTQAVSADRLQIVNSPARQGSYAIKATVQQGDDPINSSGNRNELVYMSHEPVNSEFYYRWSTRFAANFPSVKTWQLFTQWHHEGCCGSPPVEFYVYGEEIRLSIGGNSPVIVWTTPLVRDAWHDFIFHVKWSADASVGFVELYHNGKIVLPKRKIATMFSDSLNYLKVGLYRSDTVQPVGVVYHDGWVQARTLEAVLAEP